MTSPRENAVALAVDEIAGTVLKALEPFEGLPSHLVLAAVSRLHAWLVVHLCGPDEENTERFVELFQEQVGYVAATYEETDERRP